MTSRDVSVRPIRDDEMGSFSALDDSSPGVNELLAAGWADGTGRREWTLVAETDGRPVGRIALLAEPMGGGVAELEFRIAFPWLEWGDTAEPAAKALLDAAMEVARSHAPTVVERRLNVARHADVGRWRTLLERNGFALFQEKRGFEWADPGGRLAEPSRLRFATLAEVGRDAFADAMADSIHGTLDRNDRYYVARCGPRPWADEMTGFLGPEDEASSFVAREPSGALAGYVAVGEFEPGVGTIVHVAVAPGCRGRGYIDELLAQAHLAARQRGFATDLSDVDVLNFPMVAAMERNGHRGDGRPWHLWAYRRGVEAEGTQT